MAEVVNIAAEEFPAAADGQLHVVFQENGGAFTTGHGIKHPTSKNEYVALVDSNFKDNNQTWIKLFIRQRGQPFPQHTSKNFIATNKLDGAWLEGDEASKSLHVWGYTHSIGPRNPDGSRPICLEHLEVPDIYV